MGNPKVGFGVVIKMETAIGSGAYQEVAYVKGAPSWGLTRKTFNRTHHQSSQRWEEFGKALKEQEELTFEIWIDFGNAQQSSSSGILRDFAEDTDLFRWQILFPDGEYAQFYGILTKFSLKSPEGEGRDGSISIKPSGVPTLSGI